MAFLLHVRMEYVVPEKIRPIQTIYYKTLDSFPWLIVKKPAKASVIAAQNFVWKKPPKI